MKSARFFTSPNVHVTLPPNWAAISVGPCQSEVWLSTTPPIISARATAPRVASHVTLLSPYTSGMLAACSLIIKDPFAAFGKTDAVAGDSLSREAALEDLDFLVGLLDRVHADPYRFHPREAMEAERVRVAETMPASVTKSDLCLRLSRVLAVLDDGHTEISCDDLMLSEWRRASRAAPSETQRVMRFAPFIRLDDQQHLTVGWHNGAPGLDPGDRISRINGQDADALPANR